VSGGVLAEARREIDAVDRELLAAVNRRLELVEALHRHKLEHGLSLRDPGREESLVASLQQVNAGPLSADGVAEFFHHVLDLLRRELHGS
jgi:chorismate mutase/prephenate dehydratase